MFFLNIILLQAKSSDSSLTEGTWLLVIASFLAILVQIWWNRKISKDTNTNASAQINLMSNQLKDENDKAFKYSGLRLVMKFDDDFNNLAEARKTIAKIILENNILAENIKDYSLLDKKIDEVYDLFDSFGYFVKSKYIKAELVHQFFAYWFSRYYEFYKTYEIKKFSKYEETVWNNLARLARDLDIIEMEQHGRNNDFIDKNELKRFFEEELAN